MVAKLFELKFINLNTCKKQNNLLIKLIYQYMNRNSKLTKIPF